MGYFDWHFFWSVMAFNDRKTASPFFKREQEYSGSLFFYRRVSFEYCAYVEIYPQDAVTEGVFRGRLGVHVMGSVFSGKDVDIKRGIS